MSVVSDVVPPGVVPVAPTGRRFCPLCTTWSDAFRGDRNGNQDRACPSCRSLERHRFLALLLPALAALHGSGSGLTLDVAPSEAMTPLVDRLTTRRIGMDFDPGADGRTVGVQASLTQVPLADGQVDLVVCSHVLEHVPDDLAAMREIARVLSPTGIAVVAVPRRRGRATDEDPSASVDERVLRFGQADHVRYYGDDFGDRLTASGLRYDEVTPGELLPAAVVRTCAFMASETFWIVRRADAPGVAGSELPRLRADLVGELMALLAQCDERQGAGARRERARALVAEQRRRRAVERARRVEARYQRLAGKAPVRLAVRARSSLRDAMTLLREASSRRRSG